MPKQRLDYLDLLKGFAIFLMVIGHFLSWTFAPDSNPTPGAMFVKNLIYTFHMPLFFFISGYLLYLKRDRNFDISFCATTIQKRVQSLVLPGFAFMLLNYFHTDIMHFEWFLKSLFEFYLIFCAIKFITKWFNDNIILEILLQIITITALFICAKTFDNPLLNEFIPFSNLAHKYPYFALGFYFHKININRFLQKNDILYTCSLIGFLTLFFTSNQMGIIPTTVSQYFTAIFGIIVCLKVAQAINYEKAGLVTKTLLKWGGISIEIYLLNAFLIPYFPALGNLFIESDALLKIGPYQSPLHITSIFLQTVTGLVVGIYVCFVSQWIKSIVEKSSFLDFVLFGKKKPATQKK